MGKAQIVSVAKAANHGFKDDPAAAVRGWTAEGPQLDLAKIKPGVIKAGEIPFELLNPTSNEGKAIIALRKADKDFIEKAIVPVGKVCDQIFILNTGIWMDVSAPVGKLSIVYKDGAKKDVVFKEGEHMAHWQYGCANVKLAKHMTLENAASSPQGHANLYATGIANPCPRKEVKELVFKSIAAPEHNPIWLVLGVTVAKGKCDLFIHKTVVEIDPSKANGKIRRLNGTNLGPPLLFEGIGMDITEESKALDIPLMRLHDAPWENGCMKLVDIQHVFPLFHLDAKDPRSYFFKHTDDYIKKCFDTGAKVLYRLGTSIEHTKTKYFTHVPADFQKWAEICCNIIAHYNEGWADGFKHNIEYWEIWNEADIGPAMWCGSWQDYIRLYVTAAKAIKARFPKVKVGGPSIAQVDNKENVTAFLEACKREGAPLDFFSWHRYTGNQNIIVNDPARLRTLLDSYGFTKTELHLNEWHYVGAGMGGLFTSRGEERKQAEKRLNGTHSAAFACAVLSRLQDTPMDMTNFYTGTVLVGFGVFDPYAGKHKSYHGLHAFAQMLKCRERVQACSDTGSGVSVLAGRKADGTVMALITCQENQINDITLDLGKAKFKTVKALVIDDKRDLEPVKAKLNGSKVKLTKETGSAVFLVELN